MRLVIQSDYEKMSIWTPNYISAAINRISKARPVVLGLPSGCSPRWCYRERNRLQQGGKVCFRKGVTFNMDEDNGIPQEHPESFYSGMCKKFFSHLDFPRG